MKKLALLSLLILSAAAQSAPIATQVTVSVRTKLLQFDWIPVPGGDRYELWYQPNAASAWRILQERPSQPTRALISVSAHLFDWRQARFRVDSCDATGCTPSSVAAVDQLMRYSVGYFKSASTEGRSFGSSVALSADGKTLAAKDDEQLQGGAGGVARRVIYIYRNTNSRWILDGTLVAPNGSEYYPGRTLALNGDGTVLVLGTSFYSPDYRGALHVYRRLYGTWQLDQVITPASEAEGGSLGIVVDIDDAGELIASTLWDPDNLRLGRVHLYRHAGSSWTLEKVLPTGTSPTECANIALSGDGHRLARYCAVFTPAPTGSRSYVETFDAPAWNPGTAIPLSSQFVNRPGVDLNSDGTLLAATQIEGVTTLLRQTATGWRSDNPNGKPALINVSDPGLVLSRNGNFIAIGNYLDRTGGLGAIYPPFIMALDQSGTVWLHERRGGAWTLRQTLKANSSPIPYGSGYGASVALSDNGSALAVGAPRESSAATGINGDQFDTSMFDRGAVWVY